MTNCQVPIIMEDSSLVASIKAEQGTTVYHRQAQENLDQVLSSTSKRVGEEGLETEIVRYGKTTYVFQAETHMS
jgi:hypothetical protein